MRKQKIPLILKSEIEQISLEKEEMILMGMELHYNTHMSREESKKFLDILEKSPHYTSFTVEAMNLSKNKNNTDYREAIDSINTMISNGNSVFGEFYTSDIHSSISRYLTTRIDNSACIVKSMSLKDDKIIAEIIPSERLVKYLNQLVPIKFGIRAYTDDKTPLRIIALDAYTDYSN